MPSCQVTGIDINPVAVEVAKNAVPIAKIQQASLYQLPSIFRGERFDLAFTFGTLMHVPHSEVKRVLGDLARLARCLIHYELHGPAYAFDYHRYPRDYAEVYRAIGLPVEAYEVFDEGDFRTIIPGALRMSLLVSGCLEAA